MSKISVHLLDGGSSAASDFVSRTQPGFTLAVNDLGAGAEHQQIVPGLRAVGRIYSEYDANAVARSGADAVQEAREYVEGEREKYALNPAIRIWTGPNEPVFGFASDPRSVNAFAWYARFEAECIRLRAGLGLKSVIGNFSMGAPDLPLWPHFSPAFEALRVYGGWLGLHEYQDPPGYPNFPGTQKTHWGEEDWGWFFMRCARVHDIARGMGYAPRILITECGTATGWLGLRGDDGRQITETEYALWLERYDETLRALTFVDGAFIFTSGRGGSEWATHLVDNHSVLSTLATLVPVGSMITPAPEPEPPWPAQVVVGGTVGSNVRSAPAGKIVGALWRGSIVTIEGADEHNPDWLEAKTWIHKSRVTRL